MRVLKFRFWKDKKLQGILELKKGGILDMGWEWDTVDQFTGLLDKQGKEIYEGDYVKLGHYVLTVIFEYGSYLVKEPTSFGQTRRHLYGIVNEIEVIGNIYENDGDLKMEIY